VDRVERHDVINAVGLAAVLLAMALGLVWGARALYTTVSGGVVDASRSEETTTSVAEATEGETSEDTSPEDGAEEEASVEETTTTAAPVLHLPGEVSVRVGNGAGRKGIAGIGTQLVAQAGYVTLDPKNAPATRQSVVYYAEGYQADAVEVARLLAIPAIQVVPLPADPPIPAGQANLLVILGSETTLG
jgi:hypothetical protein